MASIPNTAVRTVLFVLCSIFCLPALRSADIQEILQRATIAINSDWAADPKYSCIEKEEVQKGGKLTSKTFRVVMLDGSDYHLPLAINDEPLSPDKQKAELAKLKNELQRRKSETPAQRRARINKWKSERDENGELLLDFPTSFTFQLLGEETKDGHPAYLLAANPKEGIVAATRAAKVLSGMTGRAWVDKDSLHAVHVECMVTTTVPVFGILASVLPGTQIDIGMTPVTNSIWLIDEVSMKLNVSKLHMFRSTEVTRSTYSQYRPNAQVVDELLSRANEP